MCKHPATESIDERIAYLENIKDLLDVAYQRRSWLMEDLIDAETGELIEENGMPPEEGTRSRNEWEAWNILIKDLSALASKK